jgi:hypothetical protein
MLWLRTETGGGLVNAVTNIQVPYNVRYFLTNCGTVGFSGKILLHEVISQLVC